MVSPGGLVRSQVGAAVPCSTGCGSSTGVEGCNCGFGWGDPWAGSAIPRGLGRRGEAGVVRPVPQGTAKPTGSDRGWASVGPEAGWVLQCPAALGAEHPLGSWGTATFLAGETLGLGSAIPRGLGRRGEAGAVRPVPQGTAKPTGTDRGWASVGPEAGWVLQCPAALGAEHPLGSWGTATFLAGETLGLGSAIPRGLGRRGEAGAVRPVPQGTAKPTGTDRGWASVGPEAGWVLQCPAAPGAEHPLGSRGATEVLAGETLGLGPQSHEVWAAGGRRARCARFRRALRTRQGWTWSLSPSGRAVSGSLRPSGPAGASGIGARSPDRPTGRRRRCPGGH